MKISKYRFPVLVFSWLVFQPFSIAFSQNLDPEIKAKELFKRFANGYAEQQIQEFDFDYQINFKNIPALEKIKSQQIFFEQYKKELNQIERDVLTSNSRIDYDHLQYELDLNLERLKLEERFRKSKYQTIPETGLFALTDGTDWYKFYSRYYTSSHLTPHQLMAFGKQEVERVQKEVRKLRIKMGYEKDSIGFYQHLKSSKFYLTSEKEVEENYHKIQQTVVKNLPKLFKEIKVDLVEIKPWPEAGKFTPPGYYQPAEGTLNATFYYNFYNQKHNRRATEWMFLHEGIPGHHYQSFLVKELPNQTQFSQQFYYPASTEGWAAYIENYGKELGLYQTPEQEIGKWEWDLVRSVRVVLDVGIHANGWTKEQAIAYWNREVPGQEEIAEREVMRCLNWAGQVLSYKVGEKMIKEMLDTRKVSDGQDFDLRQFHADYLTKGSRPMVVLQKAMSEPAYRP